jgi:hypothetical protein
MIKIKRIKNKINNLTLLISTSMEIRSVFKVHEILENNLVKIVIIFKKENIYK